MKVPGLEFLKLCQRATIRMPSLALTPHGRLLFTGTDEASHPPAPFNRMLEGAFARGSGYRLLELGAGEVGTVLPADFGYWRDFAARFVKQAFRTRTCRNSASALIWNNTGTRISQSGL